MLENRLPIAGVDRPTWLDIIQLEPQLADIEQRARESDPSCDPLGQPYAELKGELKQLVGWGARRVELANSVSYDVVLDRIVDALELEGPG